MLKSAYCLYCPNDGEYLIRKKELNGGRPSCLKCGFVDYHNPITCVAILIIKDKKLLLARRGIEPSKGMWDFPGGFVEAEESAEDAVIREALEETKLHIEITSYLYSLPDIYGDMKKPTLNLFFTAKIRYGEPQPKSDVSELAWFALNELPEKMAFPHQNKMLQLCLIEGLLS